MGRDRERRGVGNGVEGILDKLRLGVAIALRRRWLVFWTTAVVALGAAAGISLFFRERYEATARVFVDTQTVLRPLMENLTYQPDIDQQVGMLARTLISRPNVDKLLDGSGLGFDVVGTAQREKVVSRLMNEIKVLPSIGPNLYDISYIDNDPERARRVVEATVNLFVTSGVGAKKRDSQEASRFIDQQIRTYEGKLSEAENRLKDFKVRNFGLTGVSNQDYFARVSSLTDDVSKLRQDLSAAEQTRDTYQRQLEHESAQLSSGAQDAGSGDAVLDARIAEQRRTLDDLLRRFTDSHPDVVNARNVLSQLEAEAARKRADLLAAPASTRGATLSSNPVYQRLRIALSDSEAQVAGLRSQLAAKQQLLDQVRSVAGRQPEVEAELVQLNRDYDIIRKNYEAMVARRESAALGEKLDESSQLADFRIIEPPRVLRTPVAPSRLQVELIAFAVSLVAGIAMALGFEHAQPIFHDQEALRRASGRPVLGSVSLFLNDAAARERRVDVMRFAAAFAVLVFAQVAWLAWTFLHTHLS